MEDKKLKVALLVYTEVIAETVYDHINSFLRFSRHDVVMHDVSNMRKLDLSSIMQSDVIVIHYTVSLLSDYRFPLKLRLLVKNFKNIKVIYIQDEYRLVNKVHSALNFLEVDILFTCVPEYEIEKVYPTDKLPFLKRKINVLTGYVPENLKNIFKKRPSYTARKLDVIYRARKISAQYGALGQEKWAIVDKFLPDAKNFGLKCDLSYQENQRIYGKKWIEFLMSSKAALGVESGASVFDFTGEIKKNVELFESLNPKADFNTIEKIFFPGLDGKIYVNQISPRCFECAAVGTMMILYEGNYSGILKPWRHYVPLKKDHSNIAEVIAALSNAETWNEITTQAYNEVALNDKYSYKEMISLFDQNINELGKSITKHSVCNVPDSESVSLLHVLLKGGYKFAQKTKMLYLLRTSVQKIIQVSSFGDKVLLMLRWCVTNSIRLSRRDIFDIFRISRVFSSNVHMSLQPVIIQACILDKFLRSYLGGSPFTIVSNKNIWSINFSDTNLNPLGLTERILNLKKPFSKASNIRISFPDTLYLTEQLSGLNLECVGKL